MNVFFISFYLVRLQLCQNISQKSQLSKCFLPSGIFSTINSMLSSHYYAYQPICISQYFRYQYLISEVTVKFQAKLASCGSLRLSLLDSNYQNIFSTIYAASFPQLLFFQLDPLLEFSRSSLVVQGISCWGERTSHLEFSCIAQGFNHLRRANIRRPWHTG